MARRRLRPESGFERNHPCLYKLTVKQGVALVLAAHWHLHSSAQPCWFYRLLNYVHATVNREWGQQESTNFNESGTCKTRRLEFTKRCVVHMLRPNSQSCRVCFCFASEHWLSVVHLEQATLVLGLPWLQKDFVVLQHPFEQASNGGHQHVAVLVDTINSIWSRCNTLPGQWHQWSILASHMST